VNTLNVTTSADQNSNLIPSGFTVDPVAVALGAVPQQTEGQSPLASWDVSENFNATLDVYPVVTTASAQSTRPSTRPQWTSWSRRLSDAELLLNTAATVSATPSIPKFSAST
jgi:hypothetical protein